MRLRARFPFLPLLVLALLSAGPALPAEDSPPREAPPVKVRVIPDRTRATVGDRIVLKVAVTHPSEVTVLPPSPVPGEGSAVLVEPVPSQPPPPGKAKGPENLRGPVEDLFYFRAQAFETGKAEIPAFRVDWKGPKGSSGSVTSGSVSLEIYSVLKGPHEQPADLKPPARLPPPPFPWKAAGIAALALALVVAALVLWKRRSRKPVRVEAAPPGPVVPPHEVAYKELESLLASGLLREGRIKEFHVELAEIIKRYLTGRFEIETLERTSEEVLEEMKRARVGTAPVSLAREFFTETDLVKFAKHLPLEEEVRVTVDRAYRLVDQTKLVVTAPPSRRPTAEGDSPTALSPEAAP